AQTTDTGILGTLSDATGATVSGATVTITQPATGQSHTVISNTEGYYEVRYLLPGEYTAEVRATGFRTERQTGIVLQIGQQARINFAMQVGSLEERIEVTAEAPLMQTESGALGVVVSQERVQNLPLNGRRFLDLAALTPGVTIKTSAQYSVLKTNGTRATTMALSFDGVSATANRSAWVAVFPSLDAIQEFKVQSGNYTAEYGGSAGANVNVQLKSGSNELHASFYEFLRNDKLDARDYFRPSPLQKDILRRNQFGAVVSGPVIKDRAFFMAGWWGPPQIHDQVDAGGAGVWD